MKRTINVALLLYIVIILGTSQLINAETAEYPTWRSTDKWIYNMTIEGNPNYQRYSIYVREWGEYYKEESLVYETFETHYITRTLENSTEYGNISIRIQDTRHITRTDYKTAFSDELTYIQYERDHENRTIRTKIKYDPFIDPYGFPLNMGDKWNQTVQMNITTGVYRGANLSKPDDEDLVKPLSVVTETGEFYFHCTSIEEIEVAIADNEMYMYLNQTTNWIDITFTTLRIVQDDEETDTDGTYVVEYYNNSVGNVVKRETFTDWKLNITATLAFYRYTKTDEPWEPPEPTTEEGSEFCLCAGAIAVLLVLLLSFVVVRRRRFEEDRLTREYIEDVDTKTELVELCEEAGLSPKGSKSELRRRLLAYVEEMEEKEGEGGEEESETEEEGEDEFDIGEGEEEEIPGDIEDEERSEDRGEIKEIDDDENRGGE
jgi:hypothetical protein